MAVRPVRLVCLLGGSGRSTGAEDASTNEVGFENSAGEVKEEGQEGESFHGLLAVAEAGASVGSVKAAVVPVVVLGFEDESRQPTKS